MAATTQVQKNLQAAMREAREFNFSKAPSERHHQ
jgi:hypothetical protein